MVLVTGAAGHLGSATCEQLKLAGIEFRATDIHTKKSLGYRVVVENLLHREACYQLVDGCDALVHLAARPNEHAGTPQNVYGENCTMNINIMQAAMDVGVSKIIYASSVQVIIGNRKVHEMDAKPSSIAYLPADGDLPPAAGNVYSASKVAGENLLKMLVEHRGLASGIAMRFPGMIRPEWFDWFRRHSDIDKLWRDENPDEVASYLTFADAGRLIAACLKTDLPGYRCYFPAHPKPRYINPIAHIVTKFYPKVPLRKPLEEMNSLIDISRITADTGWAPQDDVSAQPKPAEPAKVG